MRVAVIGGGVYGAATAYFLRRAGADVRLVKRSREILEDPHEGSGRVSSEDLDRLFDLIMTAVTVYRCDRTPSCGRSRNDLQQSL